MMGSCCCKKKIKVVNKFLKDEKFDCIRQVGKIILSALVWNEVWCFLQNNNEDMAW